MKVEDQDGGHHRRDSDGLGEIVQEGLKCDGMKWDTVAWVYRDEKDAGLYLESLELLEQACKKKKTKRKKSESRNRKKRQQKYILTPWLDSTS
jgi:hypothetical protein